MQLTFRYWLALAAIAFGGLVVWLASGDDNPPRPAALPTPLPTGAVSQSINNFSRDSTIVKVGPAKNVETATISSDWRRALTNANPYSEVIRLRNLRQKGSFAVANELLATCGLFWILGDLKTTASLLDSPETPRYGARIAARTALETRCAQFRSTTVLDLMEPHSDDPHGVRFDKAFVHSKRFESYDGSAKSRDMIQALLEQGRPDLVLAPLNLVRWPPLKSMNISYDELGKVIDVVQLRLTSTPDMAPQDLRLLFNCYRWARCQYSYDELPDNVSEEARGRILRAADQLEAAMRGGDVLKDVMGF